jgi:hypothetical protein
MLRLMIVAAGIHQLDPFTPLGPGGGLSPNFCVSPPFYFTLLDDIAIAGFENRFDLKKGISQGAAPAQDSHIGDYS